MRKQIKYKVKLTNQEESLKVLDIKKDKDFYFVCCVENNKKIGFISFQIKDGKTWIYKIETNKEHFHQGIGTALLFAMEYISMLNNVKVVEAKYYPENEFAKPFYEKYGYHIPNQTKNWEEYDETWKMFKVLNYNKIKSQIENNITNNLNNEKIL